MKTRTQRRARPDRTEVRDSMVWGYRRHLPGNNFPSTVPLCLKPQKPRRAIPCRAFEICNAAPGVVIVPNTKVQVKDFSQLGIGDLVFFDADESDGTRIDHVGMYLGLDAGNHHRFISSRKGANGPTLGDYQGNPFLTGLGYTRGHSAQYAVFEIVECMGIWKYASVPS